MMYSEHDGWGPGAWIAMAFFMLMFWGVVVTAIVFLVRSRHDASHPASGATKGAEEILAERFARGEIDADEFTRRRDALRS